MRKKGNIKLITVIAVVMILAVSSGFTLAYFSDYTKASGSAVLHLTGQTEITEEIPDGNSKVIVIKNTSEDPVDMVTRVKVVGPFELKFSEPEGNNHWTKGTDDWWYYDQALTYEGDNSSTTPLNVTWTVPQDSVIENYDVAVIHESKIATYDDNGNVITIGAWETQDENN